MNLNDRSSLRVFTCLWVLLALFIRPLTSNAAECSAKSGAFTVPLLELYTSEGCSSCPSADKWLSGLKVSADKIVPLAFHVDYWDYIGWKDQFAKIAYSDRQRKIAAFGGASFVYTPQFTFNGKDFKGVDGSRFNQAVENSLKLAARVNLTLEAIKQTNGEILLKTAAETLHPDEAKHADIFIAIYENKLTSQVNAGENSGRTLRHDYVVRDFLGAYQFDNKNAFVKTITLKSEWRGRQAGTVIFVQDAKNGEILQSLQLPFCD